MLSLIETWHLCERPQSDDPQYVRCSRQRTAGVTTKVFVSLYATMVSPKPIVSEAMVVPASVGSYSAAAFDTASKFCTAADLPCELASTIQAMLLRLI